VTATPSTLDADHRRHAVVELAIRDLKEGSGLEHCPSVTFNANAAWAVLASIAHNLVRWVGALGLEITGPLVAKTIRRKFHRPARSHHARCATTPASPADFVALGHPVEQLLRNDSANYRPNRSTSRSLAARPATSSVKQVTNLPKLWLNTSARRTSGSDAINGETDPQLLARIDRLRRLHGGSRLKATESMRILSGRHV